MAAARTIPNTQATHLATFRVLIEGESIGMNIPVSSIMISREINKVPLAKIRIADGDAAREDFPQSNTDKFIPGKNIEIKLGYNNQEDLVFKGLIIQHSNKVSNGKGELMIECKDAAVKMTIARRNKHYNGVTDSDIAEELLGKYGLTADVEPTSITHKDIIQYELTDWDFMVSRTDITGRVCLVNDGTVVIKKPDLSATSVLDVLFGSTMHDYHADIDARNDIKTLIARSWDYSTQAIADAGAQEPSIAEEPGNILSSDLADVLGVEDYTLLHGSKFDPAALQEWGDARLMKQRFAKISGTVKFQGYAPLKLDTYIKLNGVGARFNGPVYVSGIRHEFTDGNFLSEVTFGMRPQWYSETLFPNNPEAQYGRVPTASGLLTGIVTDLEDPDGEDRIRVKLPIISESEDGVWARIATADAGDKRGTFFRPELKDEVLIGFLHNDSSHPVVLGMLNSSAKPAPITAANANPEKGYVSRQQLKMIFNDDEKSLKIETPAGKKVTISEQDALIKIEDENGNKITMDSAGITIDAAATLTLKGGASLKIEAPSVSINGSATTEIKGGMVKIN